MIFNMPICKNYVGTSKMSFTGPLFSWIVKGTGIGWINSTIPNTVCLCV